MSAQIVKLVSQKSDGRAKSVVLTENGRVCLGCKEAKAWGEFSKDAHGLNQKSARCVDCRNEKGRQVYKENPAVRRSGIKNRSDKLKRLYGITYADAVHALDAQFGRCANEPCGKEINLEVKGSHGSRAFIDHDHKTGKFRGMLCVACNTLLGKLENNENIYLGLLRYAAKHKRNKEI